MKERTAIDFMRSQGMNIMTHDDRLLIRAQKSDIGISENYREVTPYKTIDGRREIAGYILFNENNEITSRLPETEAEQAEILGYIPHFTRGGKIAEGVTYEMKCNQLDIRLCNLYQNAQTRYRNALDNLSKLCEMGVLSYKPRKEKPSVRNMQEAIRHRIREYAKPAEYEHNVLFTGEIGRSLYYDIMNSGQAQNMNGTLYIGGFNRYEGQKSAYKVYDIGRRENGAQGQYFKAEVTILKAYFKKPTESRGRIAINELLTQPEIQELIKEKLIRDYTKILKLATPETLKMIAESMEIREGNGREIYKKTIEAILQTNRTYLKTIDRAREGQKEAERMMKEIDKLTRKMEGERQKKDKWTEQKEYEREKKDIQREYERKMGELERRGKEHH